MTLFYIEPIYHRCIPLVDTAVLYYFDFNLLRLGIRGNTLNQRDELPDHFGADYVCSLRYDCGNIGLSVASGSSDAGKNFIKNPFLEPLGSRELAVDDKAVKVTFGDEL